MIVSADLPSLLSALGLLVSVVALGPSIRSRTSRAKHSRALFAGSLAIAEILQEIDSLRAKLSKLQKEMAELREAVFRFDASKDRASGEMHGNGRIDKRSHEADSTLRHFIDLTTEWQRLTGLKLRGAATVDFGSIQDERAGAFQAARRVVEYLVSASVRKAPSPEGEDLRRLLLEVTSMVKMELIEPQRGQTFDSNLHEVLDTVAADPSKRGTIAEVSVNGLHRGKNSIMKAKVSLYD